MFGKKKNPRPEGQDTGQDNPLPKAEGERGVSHWLVMLSILYVIAGIAMLIWPNLTLDMLGKVISIGLLVVGGADIVIYLTKDHLDGILQMDLTQGVIFVAFGAYMLLHAEFVSMALPFGVGIMVTIGGISHIQYALDMRRLRFVHWYIMLLFALVLIALGAILIYNPFSGETLIRFMAISLLLNGVATITSILTISHRFKQIKRGYIPAPLPSGRKQKKAEVIPPEEAPEVEETVEADQMFDVPVKAKKD